LNVHEININSSSFCQLHVGTLDADSVANFYTLNLPSSEIKTVKRRCI